MSLMLFTLPAFFSFLPSGDYRCIEACLAFFVFNSLLPSVLEWTAVPGLHCLYEVSQQDFPAHVFFSVLCECACLLSCAHRIASDP